jgi:predicted transposase/invertase (TIGR01784 family)
MARPVFADPKTDFVFQRIFGSEEHKPALIGLLDDLLELDHAHRVVDVTFLPPEQRPKVDGLKRSIVDIRCVDARGIHYVVEMQVLNVEAFEKRVVYNVAKAFTNQLGEGDVYPALDDVIGISICDFELWPRRHGSTVPMLSHWRLQDQKSGTVGLSSLQFVFLELPKYTGGDEPRSFVDKWAYFFREADNLDVIPPALQHAPFVQALEAARTATFSTAEWDAYIDAGMAIQDERGALTVARREGREEGREQGREEGLKEGLKEGLRRGIRNLCRVLGIALTADHEAEIDAMDAEGLAALEERITRERRFG